MHLYMTFYFHVVSLKAIIAGVLKLTVLTREMNLPLGSVYQLVRMSLFGLHVPIVRELLCQTFFNSWLDGFQHM